jgi:hypothetical protein
MWMIFGINIGGVGLATTSSASGSVGGGHTSSLPQTPKSKKVSMHEDAIDRSQLIMLAALLLQTLFLHMPTMELNKGDAEDSDYEEEVNIGMRKLECVVHMRKLLDVNGDKVPLTISLLGFDNR